MARGYRLLKAAAAGAHERIVSERWKAFGNYVEMLLTGPLDVTGVHPRGPHNRSEAASWADVYAAHYCNRPMTSAAPHPSAILIASSDPHEAELVRSLLEDEFANVSVTLTGVTPAGGAPLISGVLILVYRHLAAAEQAYIGLLRGAGVGGRSMHRSVVLCSREEVADAYNLCRRGLFDDYVMFWPAGTDIKRLPMAVHGALKQLSAVGSGPSERATGCGSGALVDHGDSGTHRRGVLIVDDDAAHRKLTSRMLASAGFELHCAANGDEALGLLATLQPALMLLDLAMPGMGGLDLMRRLRDSPRTAAMPIIIMTGNAGTEIVHSSLELGAVDFLVKPFDRVTLFAKLRRALGSEKSAEQS